MKSGKFNDKGMRRVRLLLWFLFRKTPANVDICEWVERGAARHCKLSWEDYLALKSAFPDLWQRWAAKRERARVAGWPKQPPQLRRARKVEAPRRAHFRKERPRFIEWAGRALLRQRRYKQEWRRALVLDLILAKVGMPRHELRQRLAGEQVD